MKWIIFTLIFIISFILGLVISKFIRNDKK